MGQLLEVLTSDASLYSLFEWELHVIPDFIISQRLVLSEFKRIGFLMILRGKEVN